MTKIATDVSRCVDRNGNNVVDTSVGSDVKDYTMAGVPGAIGDECIVDGGGGCAGYVITFLVVGTGDATIQMVILG